MDPALNVDPTADRFRREVFEFHRRLPGMGDAEVLGVEAGVDAAAETAAFVARAKRFHPDSAGQKDDELGAKLHAIFIRLLEAHRRLAAQAAKAPTRTPADALAKAPERAVLPPTLTAPAVIAAAPRTAASDAAARKQGVEAGLREARGLLDAGRAEESIPALQEIFGRRASCSRGPTSPIPRRAATDWRCCVI